jgi:hypothetical protein
VHIFPSEVQTLFFSRLVCVLHNSLQTCLLPRLFKERVGSTANGDRPTGTQSLHSFFALQITTTLCVCQCYQCPYKSVLPREIINNVNLSTPRQVKYYSYNGVWPAISWLVLNNERFHRRCLWKWNLWRDNWIVRCVTVASETNCSYSTHQKRPRQTILVRRSRGATDVYPSSNFLALQETF